MKIEKFEQLKIKLETLKLEKSFYTLDRVLYYFSFLGNIFLIYFGYFFIKSITDTLPDLFPYQNQFLTIFIGLFLTGYELTKRFVIEQFTLFAIRIKKITTNLFFGFLAAIALVAGSFYLSINGAHRLVDSSQEITKQTTQVVNSEVDSIAKYYDKEILFYRSQPAGTKAERRYRDSIVSTLEQKKEEKISKIENKVVDTSKLDLDKNKENDTAFVFMTFFLEFIIILGVAFNSFYILGSYDETKKLLDTPVYRKMQTNLVLLKIYYQNGKKIKGDQTLSVNKLISLVKNQNINCAQYEIKDFVVLCAELGIVKETRSRRKEYQVDYEEARKMMMKDDIL